MVVLGDSNIRKEGVGEVREGPGPEEGTRKNVKNKCSNDPSGGRSS